MAIRKIEATLECDGCGKDIVIDLDPADRDLKSYLDLSTYIEHHTDVVGEHVLCPTCLHTVETRLSDVDDPTYDQVHTALKMTVAA